MDLALERKARYLAYRSYRMGNLLTTHSAGWLFAQENWRRFLSEAREQTDVETVSDRSIAEVSYSQVHAALAGVA